MTKTELQIFKAAREHTSGPMTFFARNKAIAHFTAGASFATTDPLILQSLLQPFGDWLWRNYKQIDAQVWKERYVPSEKCYTIYQVIGNYIQHLQATQPKEDARQ